MSYAVALQIREPYDPYLPRTSSDIVRAVLSEEAGQVRLGHFEPCANLQDVWECSPTFDGEALGYLAKNDSRTDVFVEGEQVAKGRGDLTRAAFTWDGLMQVETVDAGAWKESVLWLNRRDGQVERWPVPGEVTGLSAWDSSHRAWFCADGKAKAISLDSGNVRNVPTEHPVVDLAISPDLRRLAYVDDENGLRVRWLQTGEEKLLAAQAEAPVFSPDGKRIFYCFEEKLYCIPSRGGTPQPVPGPRVQRLAVGPAA